nr:adenylate/guanylate cyclase domain-containing protein [uncultured Gellertiella sp.]
MTTMIAASIIVSAAVVHFSWSSAAADATDQLLTSLENQITGDVRRTWWEQVVNIQTLAQTVVDALEAAPADRDQRQVLATLLGAQPQNSWLISTGADGTQIAGGPIGADRFATVTLDQAGRMQVPRASGSINGAKPPPPLSADTTAMLASFDWKAFRTSTSAPRWEIVPRTPTGREWGLAYIQKPRDRVTAVVIGSDTIARILGAIEVSGGGRSYIVGPDGKIVLAARKADVVFDRRLDAIAGQAGQHVAERTGDLNVEESLHLAADGQTYTVSVSPLWFNGWQLAIIVPDNFFLDSVHRIYGYVPFEIVGLTVLAAALAILVSLQLFTRPVQAIIANLRLVEGFDLDRVGHSASPLSEINQISEAIARMSTGLASFGKFIPVDLVQSLLAKGIRPQPGGSRARITVMFTDIGGFTAMTERLGEAILPLLSAYLDLASAEIARQSGTIDKFIGDSVMAFWGAPVADDNQAVRACAAALEIVRQCRQLQGLPGAETGFEVRIGIETGTAVVGYVGSPNRLNYTAIGDVVNVASRMENLNKYYRTAILIGEDARALAGDAILVREIDRTVVPGRATAISVYEPVGIRGRDTPAPWLSHYADGLRAYRARDFNGAISCLDQVLELQPDDGPAAVLRQKCTALALKPPGPHWQPVTVLASKS